MLLPLLLLLRPLLRRWLPQMMVDMAIPALQVVLDHGENPNHRKEWPSLEHPVLQGPGSG